MRHHAAATRVEQAVDEFIGREYPSHDEQRRISALAEDLSSTTKLLLGIEEWHREEGHPQPDINAARDAARQYAEFEWETM
jgi:hypothetical protein